jgi:hypothetical protein
MATSGGDGDAVLERGRWLKSLYDRVANGIKHKDAPELKSGSTYAYACWFDGCTFSSLSSNLSDIRKTLARHIFKAHLHEPDAAFCLLAIFASHKSRSLASNLFKTIVPDVAVSLCVLFSVLSLFRGRASNGDVFRYFTWL